MTNTRKTTTGQVKAGLPYGTGSMHLRGRQIWLVYRDAEGRTIQENTHTDNPAAARQLLARRAMTTLEQRLTLLAEVVANEGEINPADHDRGTRAQTGRRTAAGKAARAADRNGRKGTGRRGTTAK